MLCVQVLRRARFLHVRLPWGDESTGRRHHLQALLGFLRESLVIELDRLSMCVVLFAIRYLGDSHLLTSGCPRWSSSCPIGTDVLDCEESYFKAMRGSSCDSNLKHEHTACATLKKGLDYVVTCQDSASDSWGVTDIGGLTVKGANYPPQLPAKNTRLKAFCTNKT